MKKALSILLAVVAVYAVLYLVVRVTCHGTVTITRATPAGGYQTNSYQAVVFLEPVSGFKRRVQQILYGVFYPLGQLDRLVNGRHYTVLDMRNVPIMKPPSDTAPAPTVLSNGSTVYPGAFSVNGTNVPMSNVTVRVIQSTNASPDKGAMSK